MALTDLATDALDDGSRTRLGIALLRITLGVIFLVTWFENLDDGLYSSSGDGIEGLVNWLFDDPDGNGSSLSWYQSLLDNTILRAAGLFAVAQGIIELAAGLALLVGAATRLASAWAMVFFAGLFLAYFGGEEWIWTYVLLFASSLTVFLGHGGRFLGVDQVLHRRFETGDGWLW